MKIIVQDPFSIKKLLLLKNYYWCEVYQFDAYSLHQSFYGEFILIQLKLLQCYNTTAKQ